MIETEASTSEAAYGDEGDAQLGTRIRQLRLARGFSIKELATRSELSAGSISQLERGIGSPSIRSLRNISKALGVTIAYFFPGEASEEAPESEVVKRASKRKTLTFGDTGTTKDVLSSRGSEQLEFLLVKVAAGGSSGPELYSHEGEEGGVVLVGTLDLWVGDRQYRLEAGDSFGFKSALPHKFSNPGTVETQVIWVNSPPLY